jgi:hypothetical protein
LREKSNDRDLKKENLEKIISLRHQVHMCPELSMREKDTLEIHSGMDQAKPLLTDLMCMVKMVCGDKREHRGG